MTQEIKKTVIATTTVPSMTHPGVAYQISVYSDLTRFCSCPAFKFQRKPLADRSCKHTAALDAVYLRILTA